MNRFYMLFAILLFASVNWIPQTANAQDESTWMPDGNLQNAVRTALNLNADDPLTHEMMLNLQGLNAPKLGITSLRGLEYATNLKSLSIGGNQIRNLKPLANLRYLTRLYMGGNRIRNISPLANLINLKRLGMLHNQISDVSVLAGLLSLRYLRLAGNPITDTTLLANLPKLSDIDIEIPSLIPDANLRAVVREMLGIEADMRITIDRKDSLENVVHTLI
jgi:internalin A